MGVNRVSGTLEKHPKSIPHACGGEPFSQLAVSNGEIQFPTPVGVNRNYLPAVADLLAIPHACGGEPVGGENEDFYFKQFPTPVGVNRSGLIISPTQYDNSPRLWG